LVSDTGRKNEKSHSRPGETIKKVVLAVAAAAALAVIVDGDPPGSIENTYQ
jgi:hypothetical protein